MTRRPVSTVYIAYEASFGFFQRVSFTVYTVFAVRELGLDPLQLVLLGTVLELTYLVFEVPTGVVADTVSRRLSVLIGVLGSGGAFLLLGLAPSFGVALVSQVLWGIFATFTSGADVAWLTDEVGEEEARRLYVRADQAWHVAALAGIAVGVALAIVDLRLPVIVGACGIVLLGLWLCFVMPEEHFERQERPEGQTRVGEFTATLRAGIADVRAHHVLLLILGAAVLHGASTEGFDRLSDLLLLQDIGLPPLGPLDPLVWFGILNAVGLVLGLGMITFVKRRVHLEGHGRVAKLLAGIDSALVVAVVAFAATKSLVAALIFVWIADGLRSVREPIFTAWLNQGLDPRSRATVNSMAGQSDAIGQTMGGPILGTIARGISVPVAVAVSGLLRLPTLALYARAVRRGTVGTVAPTDDELVLDD